MHNIFYIIIHNQNKKGVNDMENAKIEASLYGIVNSNRNFSEPVYWGKNQFNSSFPVALCCYMRDNHKNAIAIKMNKNLSTSLEEISFDDVFGTKLPNIDIFFRFESCFSPFNTYVADGSLEKIDVVIINNETREEIRPLEIKLTTLPDDETSGYPEERYGSEIVVRSPTMRYVALSMIDANRYSWKKIRKIFDPACKTIRDWNNLRDMKTRQADIIAALKVFLKKFCNTQRPLLVQPIWKTQGKASILADQCLDVFVWTDFSVIRLLLDSLDDDDPIKITRPQRAAIRLARFLYEASIGDSVYQEPIYDGMTYGTKNDKEFAISGRKTNRYMACDRLTTPLVGKNEIKNIVLGGGQRYLSPERRFDSILYFSKDIFNE